MGKKNTYNVSKMKKGAEAIASELKIFRQAKESMDETVRSLAWDDDNHRRFVALYNKEAKVSADELEKLVDNLAKFLQECSKKYGDAIDSGNSNLSA